MPDMGQQQPPQAPEGAGGGGVAEKVVALDRGLSQFVAAIGQSPVSDGVKQAFQAALEAFRGAMEGLMAEAKGGGAPQGGGQPGTVSPEQGGAAGAMPMSPAGPRGR